MIESDKTRFILDGKIFEVEEAEIYYKKGSKELAVSLYPSSDLSQTVVATLKGIEIVPNNVPRNDEDTLNWTQFICSTEGKKE